MTETITAKAKGELPTLNRPEDAPTIFADSVQGMMVSPQVMKISFIEHFMEGEVVKAKHAVNVALPQQQLRAIGELFVQLADSTDATFKAASENGE